MSYTSLEFALFIIILYPVYYLFPKKYQWTILLAGSAFFYVFIMKFYSLYILATIISIYLAGIYIDGNLRHTSETVKANKEVWSKDERKAYKKSQEKKNKLILVIALLFNFGILAVIKYFGSYIGGPLGSLVLPLGISFYTFQSTGYLIDVYRENVDAEKNIFKLALFISFFPQIVQGPIGEYDKLADQLTTPRSIKWLDFKLGIELIVWGLFKKLIIADRAVSIINNFTNNGGTPMHPHDGPYGGTAVLFVILVYALQLYTDFSGGIDISRGVARLFGIDLAINFRRPYFATSLNDYWRRWHMSLGNWMKKYVFYSLATSQAFLKLGKSISKGPTTGPSTKGDNSSSKAVQSEVRKHLGKVLPPAIATFVVFILVGIWHGSNMKYLGFGIWNGLVIMLGLVLEPWFIKLRDNLHINPASLVYRIFQMARTFILVLIGYYFDVATDLKNALDMICRTITDQSLSVFKSEWLSLGLLKKDYLILIIASVILLYFSIRLEQKNIETPGELLEKRSGFVQWIILFLGIIAILIFGIYGPGYNAADFVYMQF